MLSLLEQFLTFKPNKDNHGSLERLRHERIRIGADFGMDLDAAWFPRRSTPVVLFLHGNRHNITRFYDHYALFEALGVSCLTFDYPGYGTSRGTPSESALYASARAAHSYLVHELGYETRHIAVYGCSLGGAVAMELASKVDIGCLVTESTFTNSHEIASFLYPYLPLTRFLKRRFINDSLVTKLQIPKLFIHGAQDNRVPLSMAQTLHSRAREPRQLIVVPDADHVNCVTQGGHQLCVAVGEFIHSLASK
jgi:pimeloyl-ACP methyl ester carboxylesterase